MIISCNSWKQDTWLKINSTRVNCAAADKTKWQKCFLPLPPRTVQGVGGHWWCWTRSGSSTCHIQVMLVNLLMNNSEMVLSFTSTSTWPDLNNSVISSVNLSKCVELQPNHVLRPEQNVNMTTFVSVSLLSDVNLKPVCKTVKQGRTQKFDLTDSYWFRFWEAPSYSSVSSCKKRDIRHFEDPCLSPDLTEDKWFMLDCSFMKFQIFLDWSRFLLQGAAAANLLCDLLLFTYYSDPRSWIKLRRISNSSYSDLILLSNTRLCVFTCAVNANRI